MELSLPHTLHLFNDEHDGNVVSMNSLNIHSTNDDCTSYDENISYKHVESRFGLQVHTK